MYIFKPIIIVVHAFLIVIVQSTPATTCLHGMALPGCHNLTPRARQQHGALVVDGLLVLLVLHIKSFG